MLFQTNSRPGGLVDLLGRMLTPHDQLVRVVPVGRGHQGKSSLVNTIPRVLDTLPSGIRIGYDDLRRLNEALIRVRQTELDLTRDGLPPTLERSFRTLGLFVDEQELLRLELSDEIGQPLTDTTPESSSEATARYRDYMDATASANVLWLFVNLPASSEAASLGLFRDDLARYECWLSETLRQRGRQHPVSVALVVTKIDTVFSTLEQARNQLTDQWLLDELLRPLVTVIRKGVKCGRITLASAIPVSAFGFGNATARQKEPPFGASYEEHEHEYLLSANKSLDPFNVLTLLAWSFLAAATARSERRFQRIAAELTGDLTSSGGWHMKIC